MNKANKYSPEGRKCAVRLMQAVRKDLHLLWAAIESIAPKIGCAAQTLHDTVKIHEIAPACAMAFIKRHRETLGLVPICKLLQVASSGY